MARGKSAGRYKPTRRGRDDDDGNARWLTTYGDAVTLIMAFFVMLYAMSQLDIDKFEAFVRGLEVPFGNPAASEGMFERASSIVGDAATDSPSYDPDDRPDPFELAVPTRPDERDESDDTPEGARDPAPARTPHIDLEQLEAVQEAVEDSLQELGLEQVVDYRLVERGLVVSISADDILFDLGSTVIKPAGREIVSAIARPLAAFGNDVLVEGHTDDIPLNRSGYSNWNLSTDRAVAVLSLFAEEHGIDERRLGAVGYGEFRPLVPNTSPGNRSQNRRVDVLIVGQGVSR